ncbi:hypothetical protein [Streptomyces sp. NBC_00841]|uniref:hypothetical protein n=1 Tax=Streptomyces sp. NBC_00841 TaxID=2975847 RepID=UPI002DD9DAA6|nr:hypothetical protein [Streptomyces sp. NBC_00841]
MSQDLLLLTAQERWAYWHLNQNIHSMDNDRALGATALPGHGRCPGHDAVGLGLRAPAPTGALNTLVLGSGSRSGKENSVLGGSDSSHARSDTAVVVHLVSDRNIRTAATWAGSSSSNNWSRRCWSRPGQPIH